MSGAGTSRYPMRNPKRDLSDIALPRALIFTTSLTCGVLAALVVQIQLSRAALMAMFGAYFTVRR